MKEVISKVIAHLLSYDSVVRADYIVKPYPRSDCAAYLIMHSDDSAQSKVAKSPLKNMVTDCATPIELAEFYLNYASSCQQLLDAVQKALSIDMAYYEKVSSSNDSALYVDQLIEAMHMLPDGLLRYAIAGSLMEGQSILQQPYYNDLCRLKGLDPNIMKLIIWHQEKIEMPISKRLETSLTNSFARELKSELQHLNTHRIWHDLHCGDQNG